VSTTDNLSINEAEANRLRNNRHRVLWLAFSQVFMVIMPIAVPFFQSKGLSMQEVFSLQAVFALLVLVTEVPSGYVADMLGRKRTLLIGGLFAGVGHSLLLVADGFWTLVMFEAALAVSHSLVSGADLALAYDTELVLGQHRAQHAAASQKHDEVVRQEAHQQSRQRQVVGKLFAVRTLSEAVAGLVCSLLLLYWSMPAAVWVQAAVGWLPMLVALTLIEPPQARMPDDGHWQNMRSILRHLWHSDRLLRRCFMALCLWPLTTFYAVWLIQELWQLQGIGLVHFGYLWAALALVATVAGRYAHRTEDWLGSRRLLLVIGLLPVAGYLTMASFGMVGGLVAAVAFFLARGWGLVVLRDGLNRRVPSEFRATANSLASFGFRAGFVITGPLIGYAYDLWSMPATLSLLAMISAVLALGLLLPLVLAVSRP
jgi:hypothetical protein